MPRFRSATPDSRLIPLPWSTPLNQWPSELLVTLPRGISRHVVRFIRVGDTIVAAKEEPPEVAAHEYDMLLRLHRSGTPSVEPLAVVSERVDAAGEPLDAILLTRHLEFSLPYRALFSKGLRSDTVDRLIGALTVLLVRLHLDGFLWGDVSLSNVLFRRDASEFAAYLVDAETGAFQPELSDGQRAHDLHIATTNIYGEFCDLAAGGLIDDSISPDDLIRDVANRYTDLWRELTGAERFGANETHRIEGRIRRLNALGFDVAELDITTADDTITIQPKVVDAGHHSRRLMLLTGMDIGEHQARRLLNDLDYYRWQTGQQDIAEAVVAHQWLQRHFEAVVNTVPRELRGKREPAQIYHEVLDYRWFKCQREYREVPIVEAAYGYIDDVLRQLPDEVVSEQPSPDILVAVDTEHHATTAAEAASTPETRRRPPAILSPEMLRRPSRHDGAAPGSETRR